jgi:hypothetical protein
MAICVLCAPGCFSTRRLSAEARQRVQTLDVRPQIALPAGMYYLDRADTRAGSFGLVGVLVGKAARESPAVRIAALAQQSGIGIDSTVRSEFIRQLEQRAAFRVADAGDASIALEIAMYGMTVPVGFEDNLVPVLDVRAAMLDREGKVLWKARSKIGPIGNPIPPVAGSRLERDAAELQKFWGAAAEVVVREILDTLHKP